ncbi:hypothetical protein R1sor_013857 [Riccia sorocarpa]|uniref:Ferritin n=1 Tax=Riccia sorocarpa TaxID=122646 RepID=A0ABD3H8C8_9MARC
MALTVAASYLSSVSHLGSATVGVRSGNGRTNNQRLSFQAVPLGKPGRLVSVQASAGEKVLTGVVFEPFKEVQSDAFILPADTKQSLARQRFDSNCESAINDQINVEYNVSYIYHALFAYFDRDNVALPGFAKYFKEASEEEREHAEKLMKYQNMRGGRVKLNAIVSPVTEFYHEEKSDALYAMELALSLEKLTMEKLYALHKVAEDSHDVQLTDYIESEFLSEQVEAIKKVSEYVAQLRRIGKDGHGIYYFDRVLILGSVHVYVILEGGTTVLAIGSVAYPPLQSVAEKIYETLTAQGLAENGKESLKDWQWIRLVTVVSMIKAAAATQVGLKVNLTRVVQSIIRLYWTNESQEKKCDKGVDSDCDDAL